MMFHSKAKKHTPLSILDGGDVPCRKVYMCGLYGFIGNPDKNTKKIIKQLGISNQIRGSDSTGIAIIKRKKHTIIKKVASADKFYNGLYPRKKGRIDGRWEFTNIIGHTRYATSGDITLENAHPYQNGNLIYAHNGVIHNFNQLQGTYRTNYQVDTQIIGHLLLNNKERKVFGKLVRGSYAVPYTRLDNPKMLKIAVDGSPLTVADTGNGWYYSSLRPHLRDSINTKVKLKTLKDGYIYKFDYNLYPTVTRVKLPQENVWNIHYPIKSGLGYYYNHIRKTR